MNKQLKELLKDLNRDQLEDLIEELSKAVLDVCNYDANPESLSRVVQTSVVYMNACKEEIRSLPVFDSDELKVKIGGLGPNEFMRSITLFMGSTLINNMNVTAEELIQIGQDNIKTDFMQRLIKFCSRSANIIGRTKIPTGFIRVKVLDAIRERARMEVINE